MITIPMQLFDIPGFSGLRKHVDSASTCREAGHGPWLLAFFWRAFAGFLELMGKVTFGYWLLDCLLQFIFSVERQGGRSWA